MRLVRFTIEGRTDVLTGLAENQEIHELAGDIFGPYEKTGQVFSADRVVLQPPCTPSKIVALGLNYRDHARELALDLPETPLLFLKASSTVIGPGQAIVYPRMSRRVDYEAELAVVIGRQAKNVSRPEAFDYILGYTCLNDVTARDLQKKDGQWTRAKNFDTFCPIGPAIETDLNPSNLAVEAYLNGEQKQFSFTNNLVFDVPALIEFITAVMTLEPGDVIATGTPAGVGPVQPGDRIEIRVEKIGSLKNFVVTE